MFYVWGSVGVSKLSLNGRKSTEFGSKDCKTAEFGLNARKSAQFGLKGCESTNFGWRTLVWFELVQNVLNRPSLVRFKVIDAYSFRV